MFNLTAPCRKKYRAYRYSLFSLVLLCPIIVQANTSFIFQVSGVQQPILENVQKSVGSLPRRLPEKASPAEVAAIFDEVSETTKKALAPYGYFTPTIVVRQRQTKKDEWTVVIKIQPGPQTYVNTVHIALVGAGEKDKTLQQALSDFPLKKGMPLNTDLYEQSKKKLAALANTAGYMSPTFTKHEITVDKATHLADINLVFDTGPQYYFGAVKFNQSYYDNAFLERFPQFNTGDAYSPADVLKLQESLAGTPYFSTISVDPQQTTDSTDIPISVDLTPSKAQAYNIGVGYGTDTGPRLTATWDERHVTDTGQYFKAFLQLSTVQSTVDLRYIIPGKDPVNEQYYIGASYQQQSFSHGNNGNTEKFTVGKQQLWDTWTMSPSLSIQHDRYSLLGDPYRDTAMLLPSVSLYKTSYDNPVFPRTGYSSNLTVRGASKATYSDTSFAQAEFAPKLILSPFDFSRIILRGDLGYTAVADPATIPLSLQFMTGGSDSIRGYDYNQIGPGRYLYVGSAEYQQHVYKEWWGTAFIDAGNVINNFGNPQYNVNGVQQSNADLSELIKKSVGIGVMYASPVGPIELTVAKPLEADKGFSIQFIMGGNI
ncbi:MAG: tamA [Gammaproteobacteria bacterium]|nr:tamA [Gammaproteobacteria bacterium]